MRNCELGKIKWKSKGSFEKIWENLINLFRKLFKKECSEINHKQVVKKLINLAFIVIFPRS